MAITVPSFFECWISSEYPQNDVDPKGWLSAVTTHPNSETAGSDVTKGETAAFYLEKLWE